MDLCTLEKNNKSIESLYKALENNYKTFYLLNPDGILDSVAGLENLSISFCNISYKTIICYKCLSFFDCESNANFRKCPKCKVVNAIVPYDNIGKKVIILICFQCNNRNITNIECSYVQCYLCNYMNYAQYYNLNPYNSEEINSNRVTNRRRKINFLIFRNMCKCVKTPNDTRNNSRANNIINDEQNYDGVIDGVNENQREVNNTNINNVLDVDREILNNQEMNNIILRNEEIHGMAKEITMCKEENDKQLSKFKLSKANRDKLPKNERMIGERIQNINNNNMKSDKTNYKVNNKNKYLDTINNNENNENLYVENLNNAITMSNNNKTCKSSFNLSTQSGSCQRNSDMCYDDNSIMLDKDHNKLDNLVECGNVKRKTLLFSNINNLYNKKIIKKLSFTGVNGKRESDVKRYIEYFNQLYNKIDNEFNSMLEKYNYNKTSNIPGENMENEDFYKFLEFYENYNLKNITNYSEVNMVNGTINGNIHNNQNMGSNKRFGNLNISELPNCIDMESMNITNNNFTLSNKKNVKHRNKHTSKDNNSKKEEINLHCVNKKKLYKTQKVKNENAYSLPPNNACIEVESNKKSKLVNENNDVKSKNEVSRSFHKKKKKKKTWK